LSGASYEGLALRVFVCSGAFSDEHDAGVGIAYSEDNLVSRFAEFAASTVADVFADYVQRGGLVG
jgi:hypothetical protein